MDVNVEHISYICEVIPTKIAIAFCVNEKNKIGDNESNAGKLQLQSVRIVSVEESFGAGRRAKGFPGVHTSNVK
jgi:hypothetical protein